MYLKKPRFFSAWWDQSCWGSLRFSCTCICSVIPCALGASFVPSKDAF